MRRLPSAPVSFCPPRSIRRALILPLALALTLVPTDLVAQARLGDVDFPTSVGGAARVDFLLGLGYLHNFEYVDAAEAFRSAQERAPDFALAYWGEALTYDHPLWGEEDVEAARAVLRRLAPTRQARLAFAADDRERAYLAAVETLFGGGTKAERDEAYERAMARLAAEYPDDEDAAALHALAILGTSEGRDHETYMRAAAVAEQVIERHPRHPGAVHYLIHAYDDPIHAGLGLSAARAYAEIAPDASHALHMPSHIFFALGMWDELIAANERAWQVSVERMERKGLPPATRNFHALFWLHYGYLQAGRRDDAARVLAVAEASARDGEHRWTATLMRAHHLADLAVDGGSTLATGDAVADPAPLADRLLDTDVSVVGDRALAAGLLAVATYARSVGDRVLLERVRGRLPELADAEGETLSARLAIEALAVSDARPDSAVTLLEAANDVYFAEPYVFGPPTGVVRPPAELLGQALTELGRYREARRAYDLALSRAPGRRASVAGIDHLAAQASDGVPLRDARLTDIRRRVIERIEAGEIPSMTIVALERGRVLWSEGLGMADRETGRPATPQTVYRVGSMSKSIMATGALTLVERGLLGLDDPVASPLAKLGLEIVEHEPGDELRFWHLLNMRAGIPHGWMSLPTDSGVPDRESRDRYLGLAAHSVFPPGEVYHYSNFSTSLPSAVIEGVTGQPFSEYMRQHLFAPLGMSGAGVGAFDADPAALATSYANDGSPLPNGYQVAAGGAGFVASADDLLQYALFHLGELAVTSADVLSPELLRHQHEFVAGSDSLFALGWFRGRQMVSNGRVSGGSSWLSLVPDADVAVVCLTNTATSATDETCGEIASTLVPPLREGGAEFYESYMATWENPYEPRPELIGRWEGEMRVGDGVLPVVIELPEDGGGALWIAGSGPVALDGMVFNTRRMFTAGAAEPMTLPTPLGGEPTDVSVRLVLRLEDGRLYGYVAETFGLDGGGYRLGSYVSLERVAAGLASEAGPRRG